MAVTKSHYEKELNGVRAALSVQTIPAEYEKGTRQIFLAEWFSSPEGRNIGSNPILRGAFAGSVGLSQEEVKAWGEIVHGFTP